MRTKTFWILGIACALVAVGAVGCGGSNSSSVHPTTVMAILRNGDTWNYAISGTATPTGGGAAETISGTATATVSTSNVNGASLAITLVSNVSLNGGASTPLTVVYYIGQDANGNVIEYAESHTDSSGTTTEDVKTPSLANSELFPGTFGQGETIGETITFSDNSTENYQFQVVQPVQVSTPDGSFATWQCTQSAGGAAFGTEYWDPGLGFFVKGTILAQPQIGATDYNASINYTLTP